MNGKGEISKVRDYFGFVQPFVNALSCAVQCIGRPGKHLKSKSAGTTAGTSTTINDKSLA